MHVEIDNQSGFCFGVVSAIKQAEDALSAGHKVYSLGDIVHNRIEVQRLEMLGLKTISHEQIPSLSGSCMLIRAHGEPPSTYEMASAYPIQIIDATCPVVAALQKKMVVAYKKMQAVGGSVVLLGKKGHAEVIGLIGQVGNDVVVIESVNDLDKVDFSRPIYFLSQTTQSLPLFNFLALEMERRIFDGVSFTKDNTICRRVSSREENLKRFAMNYDVIIFVCGRKSSNGQVLFSICCDANRRSYQIEEPSELQRAWFKDAQRVGVCGATSTPEWLMTSVASAIEAMGL
ncbi:MAG: 4-hydroxy-3-methylbut-2-enyl diphosphate reductase [Alistipes sp.]|nr:4-hydroxy-3-methylbut-2-enyl diphosphate reductase [Candidatus Alistipes equi]